MTNNDILKATSVLKFTELQAYLRNTGWNRIETGKQQIVIFNKEIDGQWYETILPLGKEYGDYKYRILDVLEAIAEAEHRETHQVLTDLSLPPADIVRYRVVNSDTATGTISFTEGFNLLESAKKTLFTTACDIIQPEKYHKRLSLKGAQQFIEECRLGQTEKGSFIASVICPFINETHEEKAMQLSMFNNEIEFKASLTRQITVRMMKALDQVKNAIEQGEENKIVELEGKEIISANFLESIVELNTIKENSEIEIMTNWSVLAKEEILTPRSIKLTNDYIPVMQSIINKLKPVDEGIVDAFIGKISLIKADPDVNTRTEGEVTLNYIMGDEEKVSKAKVILSTEDYDKACEAHKDGKSVKIKGKLVSSGRSKIIENPVFELI